MAPEIADAVTAVALRMDWRPTVALTEAHRGGLVERVLTRVVLDEAVEQHNAHNSHG